MELRDAVKQAGEECLAYGKQTRSELLVCLSDTDNVLFKKKGDDLQVEMTWMESLTAKHLGRTMVHNHPYDCALSLPDLFTATGAGVEIYAFTPGGGIYRAAGLNLHTQADARVGGILERGLNQELDRLHEEKGDIGWATTFNHTLCLLLADKGLLKGYEYVLDDATKQAMQELPRYTSRGFSDWFSRHFSDLAVKG